MTPRGKKVLLGCGIGCGSVLLIVVATAIAFTIWIRRPAPPLEPERLLAADTIGYLEWRLRKEDPETAAFLHALIRKTGEIPAQADAPLPGWVLDGISQYQVRRNEAALDQLLPLIVAWTLRAGPETGREEHVFIVSMRNIGNRMRFADWIMGFTFGGDEGPATIHEHADERIYEVRDDSGHEVTFFIRDGSVYFTSDLQAARGILDRLASGTEGAGGTEALARLLEEIPVERSLRAAVTGGSGAIQRILARMDGQGRPPDPSWSRFASMTLSGGFTDDGGFAARLVLGYPGEEPPANGKELSRLVTAALERWDLEVESDTTIEPGRIGVDLLFPDLLDLSEILGEAGPADRSEQE